MLSGPKGRQQYVRHVATVHSLLRVSAMQVGAHSSSAPMPALRAADCTVYTVQPTLCNGEVLVIRLDQVRQQHCAVPLSRITSVLLSAHPGPGSARFYSSDQGKVFLFCLEQQPFTLPVAYGKPS